MLFSIFPTPSELLLGRLHYLQSPILSLAPELPLRHRVPILGLYIGLSAEAFRADGSPLHAFHIPLPLPAHAPSVHAGRILESISQPYTASSQETAACQTCIQPAVQPRRPRLLRGALRLCSAHWRIPPLLPAAISACLRSVRLPRRPHLIQLV